MSGLLDLTIVLPVRNEAENLGAALQSIGSDLAQAIVVVDSNSEDDTVKIAQEHGAHVINFQWNGQFPKKRNWFLREHKPKTKWVLFLDADEWLTEEFKTELRAALADTPHVGFWLNYSIYFLGQPLKGGYPLRKLALFRVGSGEYERIDEAQWSALDMEIHEHPVLDGSTGVIHAKIDHRDMRGPEHWARKHTEYASWEAKRYMALANDPAAKHQWSHPQKIKYRLMGTPLLAPIFFLGCLFAMGGWRDGKRGVMWARLKAGYFAQVYTRIQQERQKLAKAEN
ncbi:glycosyltransferase family 2 protein [Cerasicoccus arenae]|uniref:Glycosyl transferase n=1 Tax=Cerasicoccus arenae TaxID=424488 RepID=A0A8J3DAI8_9BACT|nr:glycosyltransferase family 2 protein [Cerasicoccus arenae]MBK1857482.1 glycosyltransferase family 2 protein [Cerasicoccus arenae]GHB95284.1 glycosyl transferase [Cerasicoccus arenae]